MLFQERVCEAIKNSGMTQKQIAEKLHIREGNITNWKKGQNLPSIEVFISCVCFYTKAQTICLALPISVRFIELSNRC